MEAGMLRQVEVEAHNDKRQDNRRDRYFYIFLTNWLYIRANFIDLSDLVSVQSITAIWLANNQTKPLVQLNTDLDPVTGLKVLTNFLLPQQVSRVRTRL